MLLILWVGGVGGEGAFSLEELAKDKRLTKSQNLRLKTLDISCSISATVDPVLATAIAFFADELTTGGSGEPLLTLSLTISSLHLA